MSIVIPTFNSEKTLAECLHSVKRQDSTESIETIVVDSQSQDETVKIARACGARVITTKQRLLGARIIGLHESNGQYVMLLDSDQVLERSTVSRACGIGKSYDMLILEEYSTDPENLLQRLIARERRLSRSTLSRHLQPQTGILLPRFFRRAFLEEAISRIPKSLAEFVVAHDHAIIYFESYRLSNRIGIVPHAIYHEELSNLLQLWKKNYRYGLSAGRLSRSGHYADILKHAERIRMMGDNGSFTDWMASSLFLSMKSLPYFIGYERGMHGSPNYR